MAQHFSTAETNKRSFQPNQNSTLFLSGIFFFFLGLQYLVTSVERGESTLLRSISNPLSSNGPIPGVNGVKYEDAISFGLYPPPVILA
jgi:hypothetical protein